MHGAGIGLTAEKNGEILEDFSHLIISYYSWNSVNGLGEKISAFIAGSSNLISLLGASNNYVIALMGLFVAVEGNNIINFTRLQIHINRNFI